MFAPATRAVVLQREAGGPDKASGSEGFTRLLFLNRGEGEAEGVDGEPGNSVENASMPGQEIIARVQP